jgi:hypothetical protein
MTMRKLQIPVVLALAALTACGESPTDPGAPTLDRPGALQGHYEWVLDGWSGARAVGQPTVQLTWQVPTRWRGEPFRVYGRLSTARDYRLIATVTSCADGICRYMDADVVSGRDYDYFVAVVDERTGEEFSSPTAIQVEVPTFARPPRPEAPQIVALDGMLYLRWPDDDLGGRLWRYLLFQERRDADSVFFQVGSTDGNAFLDVLAQNGVAYRYSVAAMDIDGHIGDRSMLSLAGIPRPDAQGTLVYAFADSAQASGFEFDAAARTGRRVAGDSPQAHWRFEHDGQEWLIRPLGGAVALDAGFTTALTCGPGSDPGCESVQEAPLTGYQDAPLPLRLEHTYVLRMGSGTAARYAKLRVQILGFGQQDRRLMIFDWAFQTVPGERALNLPG